MPNFISEDDIEQALIQRLQHLCGFDALNCYTAQADDRDDGSGRGDKSEVILVERLRAAVQRLNPDIPESAREEAIAQVTMSRRAMSAVSANHELDDLIRNGVAVEFEAETGADAGRTVTRYVRLIDFDRPLPAAGRNEYLVVSQLWIRGERGYRRPDVLLYVNGLPLVFIELKNSNVKLKAAFDYNLTSYKAEIPQLFDCNAFCMLSNGVETRLGSLSAQWEHFFPWLRVDEGDAPERAKLATSALSVEQAVLGLLAPARLLDYIENFVVFYKGVTKIVAQNHQFLGVNQSFAAFGRRRELKGKLGVFWHTQGAGKSFSMIFLVRKIFRRAEGNFSFVVVTDRDDLDGQIYRNFLHTETIHAGEQAQPRDSEQLRAMLGKNQRVLFTLIHKFRYPAGLAYPLLSERDDLVVIVDEAHRTQYKSLAENMRAGLPNANFLAFTGTPLLGRDRLTNRWFGDYVSEYNFQQSVEDGATVPLFYEKRVPEMQIQNAELDAEFYEIVEDENLTDAQKQRLEQRFAQEMEVIKRDDRLDLIADDIVYHFPRRGYLGKAIVVSVDKFTAVNMYDKVSERWKKHIRELVGKVRESGNEIEKVRLQRIVDWMRRVEMAVVVSAEADEETKFAAQKLTIKPHRVRMDALDAHGHDIEHNFKDETHPLQLVFVCAMWLTGFDAPTVSTLYLDKPMRGHTLMQAIARANRVTAFAINGVSKKNGEIVDYYNVFRRMKQALRDYAAGPKDDDELPVRDKQALFVLLDEAIEQGLAFCDQHDVALRDAVGQADVFVKLGRFQAFADILLAKDELRRSFQVYDNAISALYESCKPEVLARGKGRVVAAFAYLRDMLDVITDQKDVARALQRLGELLDESVVVENAERFQVREFRAEYEIVQRGRVVDLSRIDVDKLREELKTNPRPHIQIADLRSFIEKKLADMLAQNKTRLPFAERFQRIVDAYNAGATSTENYYEELLAHVASLREEAERHAREGLSEDELELFDLLRKETMTKDEEQRVKLAARHLLKRLTQDVPPVLVQDWFRDEQSKKRVRSEIETVLDADLPKSYERAVFKRKCDNVFDLVLDHAAHGRRWAA